MPVYGTASKNGLWIFIFTMFAVLLLNSRPVHQWGEISFVKEMSPLPSPKPRLGAQGQSVARFGP